MQPNPEIVIESVLTPIDNQNSKTFLTVNDKKVDWSAAI